MTSQTSKKPDFESVLIQKTNGPLSKECLSNKYSPCLLRALEYIYGTEGIISSGGIASVEAMFSNVDLDGKTLLDVGCGMGGVDLYLAKNHNVTIIGVEHEPYMNECANQLLSRSSAHLRGRVSFQLLADSLSLKEFDKNTFDVVLCKQVLYHLTAQQRLEYMKEMYRVLKPGGIIITEDLLVAYEPYTERVQRSLNVENVNSSLQLQNAFCYLITPEEYTKLISASGFDNVNFIDNTNEQIQYTERDVQRIRESAESFSSEMGRDIYKYFSDSWDNLIQALKPHEVISGIFKAKKEIMMKNTYLNKFQG
jgi:ubiquinone/menaquinone biosynthesis C-methylase UbiE